MQQFQRLVAMKSLEQQPVSAHHENTTGLAAAAQIQPLAQAPSSKKSAKRFESSEEPGTTGDKFSHLNDRDLYEHIMKERRRTGVGRKADPRMDKAVLACLEDLSRPRMDALCDAGFVFPAPGPPAAASLPPPPPPDDGTSKRRLPTNGHRQGLSDASYNAKNPTDDEGISFQQRRDQLNRRLRQAQVSFSHNIVDPLHSFSFANTQQSSFRRHVSLVLFELQSYIKAARNGSHKYDLVANTPDLGSNQEVNGPTQKSNPENRQNRDAAASLLALMATRDDTLPPLSQQESDDKVEQV
jgi:hypothetical protein